MIGVRIVLTLKIVLETEQFTHVINAVELFSQKGCLNKHIRMHYIFFFVILKQIIIVIFVSVDNLIGSTNKYTTTTASFNRVYKLTV